MRVVMIHGQNHKGSTYHVGRLLADKLGMESTEFFLPRDLNHFCLGCYSCIEDETKCPFWSEKKIILDAMEQADLFIFTSPNYCLAPSGPMKSFLDLMFDCWMVHRPKKWMFSKRAVIISTSAGAPNGGVIKTIKNSLFGWGIPYIKTYGIALQAMNWGMVKDEKKVEVENDMTKLAKKLRCDKKPYVRIKTRLMFRMMGLMHSAGWDSSPVEKQYWDENGWMSGKRPWKA
jgi:multimeric flavodoxin WrbA